jgi:hypothetical protein
MPLRSRAEAVGCMSFQVEGSDDAVSIFLSATTSGDIVGSYLFDHLFHQKLTPLILASAAFTAFAFVLVPLLPRQQ